MTEIRVALNSIDSNNLKYMSHNAPRMSYANAFYRAFSSCVLPDQKAGWVFMSNDENAQLYCDKREWLIDKEESKSKDFLSLAYEEYLESLFWNRQKDSNPLVILEGEVGSGKSTLIEFFLRCYCPNGSKKDELSKKIPVIVDLSTVTDENFEDELYRKIRNSIESFIHQRTDNKLKLDEINNYQMYDPILNFGSKAWNDAKGNQDEQKFRAKATLNLRSEYATKHKDWVELALKYLSYETSRKTDDQKESHEFEWPIFRYLVLCLDNIDQRSDSVQQRVIQVIRNWIKDYKFNFWQVYIPLWPSTLKKLQQNPLNSPIGDFLHLPLGQVDPICIREKRNKLQVKLVDEDRRVVEGPSDEAFYIKKATIGFLNKVLEISTQDFTNDTRNLEISTQDFTNGVRKLAGGNLRLEKEFWLMISSNSSLYEKFLEGKNFSDTGTPYYDLWNALITGNRRLHLKTSQLRNIFYCTNTCDNSRALLVGSHILFVIKHLGKMTNEIEIEEVSSCMKKLGYDPNYFNESFYYLNGSFIYNYYSSMDNKGKCRLLTDVLREYELLFANPAYLDNMAMVTPVREKYRNNMQTTIYTRNNFYDRAKTTLIFLAQLQEDEVYFCDLANLTETNPAEFVDYVQNVIRLPSVFYVAAAAYRERLNKLKEKNYFKDILSEGQWNELLNHEVFSGIINEKQNNLLKINKVTSA